MSKLDIEKCKSVLEAVSKATGVTAAAILGKIREHETVVARTLVVHVAHDFLGVQKVRISEFLNRTQEGIGATLRRARAYRTDDKKYVKTYNTITGGLK